MAMHNDTLTCHDTHCRSSQIIEAVITEETLFSENCIPLSPELGHCEQQSFCGHACAFAASNQPAQKIFILARYREAMFQIG